MTQNIEPNSGVPAAPGGQAGDFKSNAKEANRACRRQLLRGGIIGAPVILTLASRPALSTENRCHFISGLMSNNASEPAEVCSGGLSPGFWKNHTCWPSGFCTENKQGGCGAPGASKMSTYFPGLFTPSTLTIQQALDHNGSPLGFKGSVQPPGSIVWQVAAGLLNSAQFGQGYGYDLSEFVDAIKTAWNSKNTDGSALEQALDTANQGGSTPC